MPIDPSIPLQVRPAQIESPLNMLAKVLQMKSLQQESEMFGLKRAQLEQDIATKASRNKLMESLFPVGQPDQRSYNSLYEGAQGGSIGPTVANAERMDKMPAPTPGQPQMSLSTLARMAAAGMDTKNLFDLYKYQNDGVKRDANAYYTNPLTGETTYYADPTKGIDFDPKTRAVSPLPGFSQTNAGIKAAETGAIEAAKSQTELLPLGYVGKDGRPIGGSKADYLGIPNPNSQQFGTGLPAPGGTPQPGQPPQFDFVGADLLMQIPPQDRQKILQTAQSTGDNQFTVNYRLPNGKVIQGEVDLSRDSSGNVPRFIQEKADYIRGKATPEERVQFEQQAVQGMLKISDPKKRAEAFAHFYQQMNEPAGTPIRQRGSQNQAPAGGVPVAAGQQPGTRPVLQSEAEKKAQVGQVELTQGAQGEVNKNWITKSHNPVLEAGRSAQDVLTNLDALSTVNLSTGWGTEAASKAANVLAGLGVASKQATELASNAQKFQSIVLDRMAADLRKNSGPQTEGDAQRSLDTFAQLRNTPDANKFIIDLARAKANLDVKRAQYYSDALPLAIAEGNLSKVDSEWSKIRPSIWSDPVLQKYNVKKGGK